MKVPLINVIGGTITINDATGETRNKVGGQRVFACADTGNSKIKLGVSYKSKSDESESDESEKVSRGRDLYTGLIAAPPRSTAMLQAIVTVIETVETRAYPRALD